MELLVILYEELRFLVGELAQARGRIKRRPLDAEFDVIDQPRNLLCVLVLDTALPDLLLQAVEPLHELRGKAENGVAVVQLLCVVPRRSCDGDAHMGCLVPELLAPLGINLVHDFLLAAVRDVPAHNFLAVDLVLVGRNVAALAAHAVAVRLMNEALVQFLDFHLTHGRPPAGSAAV